LLLLLKEAHKLAGAVIEILYRRVGAFFLLVCGLSRTRLALRDDLLGFVG
jgi:hypothetical protein